MNRGNDATTRCAVFGFLLPDSLAAAVLRDIAHGQRCRPSCYNGPAELVLAVHRVIRYTVLQSLHRGGVTGGKAMALRTNHYDLAFETFLRKCRVPYVAVDETKRALLQDASLKSMDFIVYSDKAQNLLVDVKGRRFPSGTDGHRWENWATQDDIDCLLAWQRVFGSDFRALLVFAYHLLEPVRHRNMQPYHVTRDRTYAFYGVWADEYGSAMRRRSPRWETVWLPAEQYQQLRSPISHFL